MAPPLRFIQLITWNVFSFVNYKSKSFYTLTNTRDIVHGFKIFIKYVSAYWETVVSFQEKLLLNSVNKLPFTQVYNQISFQFCNQYCFHIYLCLQLQINLLHFDRFNIQFPSKRLRLSFHRFQFNNIHVEFVHKRFYE